MGDTFGPSPIVGQILPINYKYVFIFYAIRKYILKYAQSILKFNKTSYHFKLSERFLNNLIIIKLQLAALMTHFKIKALLNLLRLRRTEYFIPRVFFPLLFMCLTRTCIFD